MDSDGPGAAAVLRMLIDNGHHALIDNGDAHVWWEPTEFGVAVMIALVSTACWGSWSNTAKASSAAGVNFAHFYTDFCLGTILTTVAYWLGPGHRAIGTELVDPMNALYALAAGIVFGVANLLLTTGIAVAGLSIAFPLCIGTGLVLGTLLTFWVDGRGQAAFIFPGVFLALLGVICNARSYGLLQAAREKDARKGGANDVEQNSSEESSAEETGNSSDEVAGPGKAKNQASRNIVMCLIGGVLMGCWAPLSANSMHGPKGLSPYASVVCFTTASFLTGLFILTGQQYGCQVIPRVDPVTGVREYFKIKPVLHLWGLLGGIIWATGTTANLVSGGTVGFALSYALGQTAPVVAILWGLGWYREFDGAPRKAIVLIGLMFALFIGAIVLLCLGGRPQ